MEFKDYKKLAELLREARKIMFTHERPKGKTKPINKHYDKAIKSVDMAISELEEMMFIDCPGQATIYIFHPGNSD